jgi:hypothetical protein
MAVLLLQAALIDELILRSFATAQPLSQFCLTEMILIE